MTHRKLLGPPHIQHRDKGLRRWAVAWSLYDFDTTGIIDRRKEFFTFRGAMRWLERQRVDHRKIWNNLD